MARDFSDKTSTCGSCIYWTHRPEADGIHATRLGVCNWHTLPAWAYKPYKKLPIDEGWRKMREDDGNDPNNPCWCHTKREPTTEVRWCMRRLRSFFSASGDGHG
jgi:hypothetical protein